MKEEILQTGKQEEREGANKSDQNQDIWEKKRQAILDAKKDLTAAIVNQIKSVKTVRDIKDTMRTISERVGHSTYQYLLSGDDEYLENYKKICDLEKICMELGIEEDKQEKVCELIREWNGMEYHFAANAYMAGMLDGYAIFRDFELL